MSSLVWSFLKVLVIFTDFDIIVRNILFLFRNFGEGVLFAFVLEIIFEMFVLFSKVKFPFEIWGSFLSNRCIKVSLIISINCLLWF